MEAETAAGVRIGHFMVPEAGRKFLVIIPAFNEQGAINQVVSEVRRTVPEADILVIDDGSQDGTAMEAQRGGALVVRHAINLGIGGAVQTGLKFARLGGYEVVARLDGDGQHDPEDIPRLYEAMRREGVDMVVGSRFLAASPTMSISFTRRLGIFAFALVVSCLTRRRATDTTSGLACMNRRAVDALAVCLPQDYPEVEGRIIMHKSGLKTLEYPTPMRARRAGTSSIDAWRSFYYACKVMVAVFVAALKAVPIVHGESK
jgi:glycosyltransferase involved in cell wall biosynthesis